MSAHQNSSPDSTEIAETPGQRLGRQLAQLREISAIALQRLRAAEEVVALTPLEQEDILDDDAPEPIRRRIARTAIITYGTIIQRCIAQENRLTAALGQPAETPQPETANLARLARPPIQ